MGIYVTGDCHGDFKKLIDFIERMSLDENDTIIVLGDMGLLWNAHNDFLQYFIANFYEVRYKTEILWIDGNHENFDLIKKLPSENGFKICSPHIKMIERGNAFILQGKVFLACGGADSVDKEFRKEGVSWWKDEQISQNEVDKIVEKYKDYNFDYILTHAAPTSIVKKYKTILFQGSYFSDKGNIDHTSENRLDKIKNNIRFKKWFFGHYHNDVKLNRKFTCFYNDFKRID